MSAVSVGDRIRFTGLAASQGFDLLRRKAMRPFRFLERLRARAPERLLIAPQDIRTADPTIAEDIYAGYFALAGKVANAHGRSPFDIESPSSGWSAALAGFGWLRHLRAAETALARSNARALVDDWIVSHGAPDGGVGWNPPTAARRLLSWLAQSPLILDGADRFFYRRFMRSIGRHASYLECALANGADHEQRLLIAVALAELGLCAAGLSKLQRRASRILEAEVGRQILPDGGHMARNPQTLINLLLDFLPLKQAYAARGVDPPQQLLNAVDRMTPMLRLFRHSNGEIALFNGMGPTRPDVVATVLAYDDARAKPIVNAPWSGYQRLEAFGCALVMDVGKPPPPRFSRQAHASALAFEFSSGANRLIVNCGAPSEAARRELRQATRTTAAHSTLTIDDVSSCRFASQLGLDRWLAGQIVSGPTHVEARRSEENSGMTIDASHDGYRRYGVVHSRRIFVQKDGRLIAGRDALEAIDGAPAALRDFQYAVRFHLHPAANAVLADREDAVFLVFPDGEKWRMRTDGAPIAIEESIFLGGADGSRPTRQLVIRRLLHEAAECAWSFERLD